MVIAPRTPCLIWVHGPGRGVGDLMVDRSTRKERLRPLNLSWAAAGTRGPAGLRELAGRWFICECVGLGGGSLGAVVWWRESAAPRVVLWVVPYKRTTQRTTLLPARCRELALALASRKGVPTPPLRFDPGTPFLDHNIYRCFTAWPVQSGQRERAGSRKTSGRNAQHEHRDDQHGDRGAHLNDHDEAAHAYAEQDPGGRRRRRLRAAERLRTAALTGEQMLLKPGRRRYSVLRAALTRRALRLAKPEIALLHAAS
jgi:hypothetical protein